MEISQADPDSSIRQDPPEYNASMKNSPPTYESLYGRVKAAKSESSGSVNFIKMLVIILMSTIGFTICLALFLAIPISMIVIGAVYLDDCPAERMIPIYLIVAGSVSGAVSLLNLVRRMRRCDKCVLGEDNDEEDKKIKLVEGIVNCFLFGWFIAGCVFIYRTKDDFVSGPEDDPNYCHEVLYWFAFWITTACFIAIGAACCCCSLVGCIAICWATCGSKKQSDAAEA